MAGTWFKRERPGFGATPCSWQGWALSVLVVLLAAAIVLTAPGIRDNLLRPLFLVLGLATVLVPYGLIVRAKAGE